MAALPPTNVSISGQTCEMAALLQSASSSSWSICTPDSMSLCLCLLYTSVIWMFVIALLLFLGMFMETLAIILLATPVLLPVMTAFGVDPIHFGVVLVCCCGVGFSTPPLGENIFIASGIADTTLEDISYNALPFVFVTAVSYTHLTPSSPVIQGNRL